MWTRSVLGISVIGAVVVAAAIGMQTAFGLAPKTVEFQDGAGNLRVAFFAGETVQAYVLDDSLGTVATSSATWAGLAGSGRHLVESRLQAPPARLLSPWLQEVRTTRRNRRSHR